MSNESTQQQPQVPLLPLAAIVGLFFLFLFLVFIFYVRERPPTVASGSLLPEERHELLRELRETEKETMTTYGWVDRDEGMVRLPIERAMELTIQEINGGRSTD